MRTRIETCRNCGTMIRPASEVWIHTKTGVMACDTVRNIAQPDVERREPQHREEGVPQYGAGDISRRHAMGGPY